MKNTEIPVNARTMLVYATKGAAHPTSSSGDGWMVLREVAEPGVYRVGDRMERSTIVMVEGEKDARHWVQTGVTVDFRSPRPRTDLESLGVFDGSGGVKGATRVR